MLPITAYPEAVNRFLPNFDSCFKRVEQLRHFAEYVTGLIVSWRYTVKSMNDQFVEHRDQSTKNRFINDSPWSTVKVNRKRIQLILQKLKGINRRKCLLVIDDVKCAHSKDARQMAQLSFFKDTSNGGWINGHVMVTAHLFTPLGHFPIDFRFYYPHGTVTKIRLACWLVKKALYLGLPFKTVVFDSWYLAPELIDFIEALNLNIKWVSRLASNRVMLSVRGRIPIVEYLKELDAAAWTEMDIDGKTYTVHIHNLKLSDHRKVRMVAYQDREEECGYTMLASNALDWEAASSIRAYRHRWTIDHFYRDAKQNLGLEGYMLRDIKAIKRHWYLVFVAFTFLQLSSLDSSLVRVFKTNAASIGNKCRQAMCDTIRSFITWTIKLSALEKSSQEIFELAFLPRSHLRFVASS